MTIPPALTTATRDADYTEEKRIRSHKDLPAFLRDLFAYTPPWLRALYRARVTLLALLGHTTGTPALQTSAHTPVPFTPGDRLAFFDVEDAQRGTYWLGVAREAHLTARLGVLREPSARGGSLYRVITIVHIHNRAGRAYFTIIRPFHHLVVNAMMRHAARHQETA